MTKTDDLPATSTKNAPFYIPLKVSSAILLHIGAGIYSSVAGAIKELVSNAFDADATRVTIMTGYPEFEKITVVDNGSGMTEEEFKKAMSSIGSSLKRELTPQGTTSKYKRPIIGHLGIGLMALSQICNEAIIESQAEDAKTRFVAKLNFGEIRGKTHQHQLRSKLEILRGRKRHGKATPKDEQEFEKTLRELEESVSKDARKVIDQLQAPLPEGEHLGYCLIYPKLPAIPGGNGTTLTLASLDPAVIATFRDENRSVDALPKRTNNGESSGGQLPWDERRDQFERYTWEEICTKMCEGTISFQQLPQYHQFLWELAIMSPVRYFKGGPVAVKEVLVKKRQQLENHNFSVIADNREIFKPVKLPSAKLSRIDRSDLREDLDYFVDIFDERIAVGRREEKSAMTVVGYMYWQKSQVVPSRIRGIQIYIRNVGIGLYDNSLLKFSTVNPTSRAGQISGEIYVDDGLESALNVDRNSFRETDKEYIALRDFIWERLGSATKGDGIIGRSVSSYWNRKELKEKQVERLHLQALSRAIENATDGRIEVEIVRVKDQPIFAESGKKKIVVNILSRDWPRSTEDRRRAQLILVPFKAATMLGKSVQELSDLLQSLILSKKKAL